MKTFIKVTEIWVPNKRRTHLQLSNGHYGDYKAFKKVSEKKQFALEQGLPGAVWAAGHPIVLTDLKHSYFERSKEADKAGLTCAIAVPVMAGEFLLAVIVFFCGDAKDDNHAGAIEVWSNTPDRTNELGVVDGYYGSQEYFEFVSRKTKIMKGFGLPGMVWEKQIPVLLNDLGDSTSFIRGRDAKNAGITTGIGIPVAVNQDQVYIMTFLSAKKTPIAKYIQIWAPDDEHQKISCQSSFGTENDDLASVFNSKTYSKGEGLIGQVWLTGVPVIGESSYAGYTTDPAAISSMLAMPVLKNGKLKAVVTFLF